MHDTRQQRAELLARLNAASASAPAGSTLAHLTECARIEAQHTAHRLPAEPAPELPEGAGGGV